jgi:hypothetical protein
VSPAYLASNIKPTKKNPALHAASFLLVSCLAYSLAWRSRWCVLLKHQTFSELHGVTTQKTKLSNNFAYILLQNTVINETEFSVERMKVQACFCVVPPLMFNPLFSLTQ